jgi:hypothetical protein
MAAYLMRKLECLSVSYPLNFFLLCCKAISIQVRVLFLIM